MDKRTQNAPKKQAKTKKADQQKSAEHKIVAGAFKSRAPKKS